MDCDESFVFLLHIPLARFSGGGNLNANSVKIEKIPQLIPMKKTLLALTLAVGLTSFAGSAKADIIGLGDNGTGWTLNYGYNSNQPSSQPSINDNVLTIVDGRNSQNSAFYNTKQNISDFTASFVWQNTDSRRPADGFTFTIQNQGATAVGTNNRGSGLGYDGISSASGVAFNIYTGHTVGLNYAPGNVGTNYFSTSPVNFASTNPINVLINYADDVLDVSVTDIETEASYSKTFNVNLPNDVGDSMAYVGFTGGSWSFSSRQLISNFQFIDNTASVPEPSTYALFGIGSIGLLMVMRRKKTA
jgi:opacity protein-like surface antigen